jgi:hypothetical protein
LNLTSLNSSGPELEIELHMLREAADNAADYVHARGRRREERLLDIPERVRDVVEFGIHRGTTDALAAAQVQSGHELCHLVGFPEGEGGGRP